ncbi:unnamed protein product [Discula destructiva]
MPRAGAVTRSMTRDGMIVLQFGLGQAASRRSAEGDVKEALPSTQNTITCRGSTAQSAIFEPSTPGRRASSSSSPLDILTKNRMTILRLEQIGALTPGVLTITPSGELQAELSLEPDRGTMAGLFPNMAPSPDADEQIPSWLRDYLLTELNVHGHGPPANCRALYVHLKEAQEDSGINNTVRTTEGALAYAAISLRYALEEVRSFVDMKRVHKETYDKEVQIIIKNIKRLVGYEGDEMSTGLRMLVEIADMGFAMKDALTKPLESEIIVPYTRLLEKMELVSKGLRVELDRVDEKAEKAQAGAYSTPDSGIAGCWS